MASPGPGKKLCGAKTPKGKYPTCHNIAGKGTDHKGVGRCKRHGGNTRNHKKAASLEIAKAACETLGLSIDTNPADALIAEVKEAAGNVGFYRRLIQELPTHPAPDVFVVEDGEGHWERGDTGIYGRTYHATGVPTGEAKEHILVRLYNEERKRLREASSEALKAGVEERRMRMAEADADRIMDAHAATLVAMGLTDRMEEFRALFVDNLRAGTTESAHLGAAETG